MNDDKNLLSMEKAAIVVGKVNLLQDIYLALAPGEIAGIIGPNGAGKTTLLRGITGDLPLAAGSLSIHQKTLKHWQQRELARSLASLPQQSYLNFPFTVREVVTLSRLPHDTGRILDQEIVDHLLLRLDIQALSERNYTQLSGGEKQRVQLARVIAQLFPISESQPKLLVLDEPCNGLDLKHQKCLRDFLQELSRQGVAIIVTAHDLNWILSLCHKVMGLKQGRAEFFESIDAVFNGNKLQNLFDVTMHVNYFDNQVHPIISIAS